MTICFNIVTILDVNLNQISEIFFINLISILNSKKTVVLSMAVSDYQIYVTKKSKMICFTLLYLLPPKGRRCLQSVHPVLQGRCGKLCGQEVRLLSAEIAQVMVLKDVLHGQKYYR